MSSHEMLGDLLVIAGIALKLAKSTPVGTDYRKEVIDKVSVFNANHGAELDAYMT